MSERVWKYQLNWPSETVFDIPESGCVLGVSLDPAGDMVAYAIINPSEPMTMRVRIRLFFTGEELPDEVASWSYIGTLIQGPLAHHAFISYIGDS